MKFAIAAVTVLILAQPVTASAQGYAGVIADGKSSGTQQQQQVRPAPTDNKAGYAGVMSWTDNSGGTAYSPEDANIYNFVNNSGTKATAQERKYQAHLKSVEERRAKIKASLKAQADARQKANEAQAAEAARNLNDVTRQIEEQNRKAAQQQRQ